MAGNKAVRLRVLPTTEFSTCSKRQKTHHSFKRRDLNMGSQIKMTGRLIAAARALTGISREDFGELLESRPKPQP